MGRVTVEANQCDACGFTWLGSPDAERCASQKCRSRAWNRGHPSNIGQPGAPRATRKAQDPTQKATKATRKAIPASKEPQKPREHNPKTCKLYKCLMCQSLGHKDPKRGLT